MTYKIAILVWWSAILSSALFLTRCQSADGEDIRRFYFAEGELKGGKIYVYRPVGTPADTPADYWYQKMIQTDSGTFLMSRYLDKDMRVRQMSTEKITASGAVQKELMLFEADPVDKQLVETPVRITDGAMYPFQVLDTNTMVVYTVRYQLPGRSDQRVVINRNRRYAGVGPTFKLAGKDYATIKMKLIEKIVIEGEGDATIDGWGEEWYAEGLGRVYYKKSLGDGRVSEEYELVEVRDCASGGCLGL
jgi:hypothetical protein